MSSIKNIPPVDQILKEQEILGLLDIYNRKFVTALVREATDIFRQTLKQNKTDSEAAPRSALLARIVKQTLELADRKSQGTLIPVINGTGVVLHTNLGRAPLGGKALARMQEIAASYNNLELDLISGERDSRYKHVEELLCQITGAEAALVVNNNAAAVLLSLNTLAQQKQVIVSRGQLIEIGGSFRIPEIMKMSGALLCEVGTTNKTYRQDFTQAITEETGLLFAAHTSNYKIVGFAEDIQMEDLVYLGREHQLPVMMDLGSGELAAITEKVSVKEPLVQDCVAAGVDIITFSGDKLLGGPQAGLIVGKKQLIEKMKKNQLLRALRVDKITLAALESTLLEYLTGNPLENVPVLKMLKKTEEELKKQAQSLLGKMHEALGKQSVIKHINIVPVEDLIGGGAYPTYYMAGMGLEIEITANQAEAFAQKLRMQNPAVLVRIQEGRILISVRTLLEKDEEKLVGAFKKALAQ